MSDIRTRPITDEYAEGFERTFGERKVERGRFVWDARQGKLVRFEDYTPEARALDAPIMVDRFREGAVAPDGTPIDTRRREREWMNATGTAHYDDFKGAREKRQKELEAKARGEYRPDKPLRDLIGRELYKHKVII